MDFGRPRLGLGECDVGMEIEAASGGAPWISDRRRDPQISVAMMRQSAPRAGAAIR
jgi:hypothetical protein